jgi:hypothetical protein
MFAGPEYASYVQLCRELLLERELQQGDFYVEFQDALRLASVHVYAPVVWPSKSPVVVPRGSPAKGTVWLPRLDQWLAMLEGIGVRLMAFEPLPPDEDHATETWNCAARGVLGVGVTREEAAARLWMALAHGPAHDLAGDDCAG